MYKDPEEQLIDINYEIDKITCRLNKLEKAKKDIINKLRQEKQQREIHAYYKVKTLEQYTLQNPDDKQSLKNLIQMYKSFYKKEIEYGWIKVNPSMDDAMFRKVITEFEREYVDKNMSS